MNGTSSVAEFGKWRAFFWPVHRHELKKLVPMLLIFFLLFFDYNVLRCMKDTLVITAKGSGAEVIPFIKVWVMFPSSVLLTWVFIRLSNRFDREKVFYIMLSLFLGFFSIFAFVLYPMGDSVHCHGIADRLSTVLPIGCRGLISMVRYWSFTIFYAMAELWGNIILFVLFWGFTNQVTKFEEAKRFYGLFGVGINLSGIAAGQLSIVAAQFSEGSASQPDPNAWGQALGYLIAMTVGAAIISLILFALLNRTLRKHPELTADSVSSMKKPKEKIKLSMRENFRYLLSSRYMLYLVTIVVSYNIIINLTEILWKHEACELYPNPTSYNIFMSQVTTWTGILATLSSLLISGNSLRLFGWTKTAMITPTILLVTSIGFFSFFFLKETPEITAVLSGVSPLMLIVFFGTVQNCFSRASKYTVFDATKEMVFIPLSQQDKIKGKAAVDGVCNRLGKSGGSVIFQFLLLTFSTITASAPYVAIILFSIIAIWMMAIRSLGKQFTERTQPQLSTPTAPTGEILVSAT